MSNHYEWILSLRLKPETPDSFLAELRYHLGLSDEKPETPELDCDYPCLVPDDSLAGGGFRSLVLQTPYLDRPSGWGLFLRTEVLDDGMYELVQIVPPWLARWSLTQGFIGWARERLSLHPWMNFYVQEGHAYWGAPGKEEIAPLDSGGAPPFTLRYTTDSY